MYAGPNPVTDRQIPNRFHKGPSLRIDLMNIVVSYCNLTLNKVKRNKGFNIALNIDCNLAINILLNLAMFDILISQ